MDAMLDESGRRKKAAKMIAVLKHFTGRTSFEGLLVLDLGCSSGFIADEFSKQGAQVVGLDIDVPGLAVANEKFAGSAGFICGAGEKLPLPEGSVDLVIFNHIYEHVLDPDTTVSEIRRVLKPDGAVYLGLGNRLGIVEPHYKLPFLSYLPPRLADRYIKAAGKADHYHEQFRARPGLRKMVGDLAVWDYTYSVLTQPDRFHAEDLVPRRLRRLPLAGWKVLQPILPTFIWVGSPSPSGPQGETLGVDPTSLG
jgi:SAM-dependent methyltransferase